MSMRYSESIESLEIFLKLIKLRCNIIILTDLIIFQTLLSRSQSPSSNMKAGK